MMEVTDNVCEDDYVILDIPQNPAVDLTKISTDLSNPSVAEPSKNTDIVAETPHTIYISCKLENETKFWGFISTEPLYSAFLQCVSNFYENKSPLNIGCYYLDDDGDTCRIASDEEMLEALRVCKYNLRVAVSKDNKPTIQDITKTLRKWYDDDLPALNEPATYGPKIEIPEVSEASKISSSVAIEPSTVIGNSALSSFYCSEDSKVSEKDVRSETNDSMQLFSLLCSLFTERSIQKLLKKNQSRGSMNRNTTIIEMLDQLCKLDPSVLNNATLRQIFSLLSVHALTRCATCDVDPIVGIRHSCQQCRESLPSEAAAHEAHRSTYNLCNECYLMVPHDPNHVFQHIEVPREDRRTASGTRIVSNKSFANDGNSIAVTFSSFMKRMRSTIKSSSTFNKIKEAVDAMSMSMIDIFERPSPSHSRNRREADNQEVKEAGNNEGILQSQEYTESLQYLEEMGFISTEEHRIQFKTLLSHYDGDVNRTVNAFVDRDK